MSLIFDPILNRYSLKVIDISRPIGKYTITPMAFSLLGKRPDLLHC
jgi:hypothetical protein